MKKILLFSLAAALVVALTMPAAAKTELKVSGEAFWRGFSLTNVGAVADSSDAVPTAFMEMAMAINMKFQVNPALAFGTRIEALQKKWGREEVDAQAPAAMNNARLTEAKVEIAFPWGWWRVGRYQATTGYIWGTGRSKVGAPRAWDETDIWDPNGQRDRIIFGRGAAFGQPGPWTITLLYEKINEGDSDPLWLGGADSDLDLYWMNNTYKWKGGGVTLITQLVRNYYTSDLATWEFNDNRYKIEVNAGQKFGPMTIAGNVTYFFGTRKMLVLGTDTEISSQSHKAMEYCFVVEYKKGPVLTGFGYYHSDGQDTSNDITAAITSGRGFRPLYAAFGNYDGLLFNTGNLNLITAFIDYNLTSKLILHVAGGYITADEVAAGNSKKLGMEVDGGLAYEIVKGLTLGLHVGYFMPQDGWEDMFGNKGNHTHVDGELRLKF